MAQATAVPSFVQEARRRQLVECAIAEIAEVGLSEATSTRIAKRARISRGLVGYHFADRGELLAAVVAEVYRLGQREVGPPVGAAASPREQLLAFVEASVRFYLAYPAHLAALGEIHRAARRAGGPGRESWHEHRDELADVRAILTAGRQAGQFREFDDDLVAAAVRAVLDSALHRLGDPDAEVERVVAQLREFVDAATAVRR